MFNNYISLLLYDIAGFFANFTFSQATIPLGILAWFFILFLPLKGVDRQDIISALTYMVVLMALGVGLVLAIPQHFVTTGFALHDELLLTMLFGIVALGRWFLFKPYHSCVVLLTDTDSAKNLSVRSIDKSNTNN